MWPHPDNLVERFTPPSLAMSPGVFSVGDPWRGQGDMGPMALKISFKKEWTPKAAALISRFLGVLSSHWTHYLLFSESKTYAVSQLVK